MEELFEAKSDDLKKQSVENAAQLPVPQDLTKDDWLLAKVLDAGNIEILERFLKAKHEEEDRQAKRLFDENFAKMQSEFTAVARDKQGYEYKYAPLETLQKGFGATIAKYGFSYRWREESIADKPDWKRVIMIISGWGYEKENSFDVPPLEFTGKMKDRVNAVQAAGGASTYGQRYTFKGGFGLIIEGEDDDAASFGACDIVGIADEIKKMKDCENLVDMQKVFTDSYHAIDGDKSLDAKTKQGRLDMLIATKDELKKSLQ